MYAGSSSVAKSRPGIWSPAGEPANELLEAARVLEADLLVVERRNALKRALLGSPSAAVVRGAPCDVLVVR